MTEDVNDYRYDFETEVNRLRQFIGTPADKIIYIDVGIDPENPVPEERAFIRHLIHNNEELYQADRNFIRFDIDDFAREPETGTYTKPVASWERLEAEADGDDEKLYALYYAAMTGEREDLALGFRIVINDKDHGAGYLGKRLEEMWKLFTLYHETGHGLTRREIIDEDHPYRESSADAYAALLMLRRFGQEAVPFLHVLSWLRSSLSLSMGETSHFSSTVVDKIIFDSQREDFSQFAAEDILKRAKDYAGQWTPTAYALRKAREDFERMKNETDPVGWLLGTTSLSGYAPDNLAFYIAAKSATYSPPLEIQTEGTYTPVPLEPAQARRLADRAAKMKFSAVFNNAAAKALEKKSPTVAEVTAPHLRKGMRP